MKRTNIYLSDEQRERLQRLADRVGLREAELIRRAIDRFLDQEETRLRIQAAELAAQPAR